MTHCNRRQFLAQCEAAALLTVSSRAALPLLLGACASVRYVKPTVQNNRLVVARSAITNGGTALVETSEGQLPLLLRHTIGNEFVALSTRCTHRGCQVELAGKQFRCPCHGSVYTLNGEVVQGPASLPLARHGVTADEQNVYIERVATS